MIDMTRRLWLRFGILFVAVTLINGIATGFILDTAITKGIGWLLPPVTEETQQLIAEADALQERADRLYEQSIGIPMVTQNALITSAAVVVISLLSLPIALWSARRFTRPIGILADAARAVANGDFAARANTDGPGELNGLIADFNFMAESLMRFERETVEGAAAVAHELRTPLTILQSRLHAVNDGVLPFDEAEVKRLLTQVETLSRLVSDIGIISLADANRIHLSFSPVNLAVLVKDIVDTFQPEARRAGLVFEMRLASVRIEADPVRLKQIVLNLLSNAVRYAAQGEWACISVSPHQGGALLTVEDRGPGFASLDRVFEAFYRDDRSRSRDTGGMGLGLSVVAALVEAHGGRVEAKKRPVGARIEIWLPAKQIAVEEKKAPAEAEALSLSNSRRG